MDITARPSTSFDRMGRVPVEFKLSRDFFFFFLSEEWKEIWNDYLFVTSKIPSPKVLSMK